MDISKIESILTLSKATKIRINKEIQDNEKQLKDLTIKEVTLEQAQVILQKVAQDTQNQLKFQIEDIVNTALETVFPNEYEFVLDFEILRGKTEAKLKFYSQSTGREIDPMNASGGGVVDIVAFALRIACYVLDSNIDNVIVLDEPFRFISRDLQNRAGDILKSLSNKMGIQFIIVTHINEIMEVADTIFHVKKDEDNVSCVYIKQ